jgi:elongation factor G
MADKERTGAAGTVPVPDSTKDIRNVVLVGHSGSGKTTLVEAMLHAAGVVQRPGSVTDGSTVTDFDDEEARQQRSIGLALAPLMHHGTKVNLLDAPGYADFVGELRAGLRAADAALFVVSAVDGVDGTTRLLWEECAAVGMPRAIVLSRLDHARADFDEAVAICQRVFGDGVLPLHLPLHDDDHHVAGLIDLLTQRIVDHSSGTPVARDAEPEHLDAIAEARNRLLEGIIAESEDESLMDQYLAGEDIPLDTVIADLEKAVARARFFPVVGSAATLGLGIAQLLDLIVAGFPTPEEHVLPDVSAPDGSPRDPLTGSVDGPLCAEVVKTTTDPYVGRISLVRVFSGRLRPDQTVHVSGHMTEFFGPARGHEDHDVDERVGALSSPLGRTQRAIAEGIAGDIVAVAKLTRAETGDT